VKELPGCFASGHDLDEMKEALVEAIGLYLSNAKPDESEQPGPSGAGRSVRPDQIKLVT
jgi:predicted RNase H-like HicB family nuclease